MERKIKPEELIPGYWPLKAGSFEDIIFFGRITIKEMVKAWEIKVERSSNLEIKEKIEVLKDLEKRAQIKPAMPDFRPCNWFKIEDPVVCFIGNRHSQFVTGEIAACKESSLTVCYHDYGGENFNGHDLYEDVRPEIMHLWEHEYLEQNSAFTFLWARIGTSKDLKGFEVDHFLAEINKRT